MVAAVAVSNRVIRSSSLASNMSSKDSPSPLFLPSPLGGNGIAPTPAFPDPSSPGSREPSPAFGDPGFGLRPPETQLAWEMAAFEEYQLGEKERNRQLLEAALAAQAEAREKAAATAAELDSKSKSKSKGKSKSRGKTKKTPLTGPIPHTAQALNAFCKRIAQDSSGGKWVAKNLQVRGSVLDLI